MSFCVHADDIVRFVADFTVHVEGVGDVCSLACFDLQVRSSSGQRGRCNSWHGCQADAGAGRAEHAHLPWRDLLLGEPASRETGF